jgi:hypothetical protein
MTTPAIKETHGWTIAALTAELAKVAVEVSAK